MPSHGPRGDPHKLRRTSHGSHRTGLPTPRVGPTTEQRLNDRNFRAPSPGGRNFIGVASTPVPRAAARPTPTGTPTPTPVSTPVPVAPTPAPTPTLNPRGEPIPGTVFQFDSLLDQYLAGSFGSTALNVAQFGPQTAMNQSSVFGPTFRGFNFEPPTQAMRQFEEASGFRGAAETLARQQGNRIIPSPFLWIFNKLFFQNLSDQAQGAQA